MKIPSLQEAEELIAEAERRNKYTNFLFTRDNLHHPQNPRSIALSKITARCFLN